MILWFSKPEIHNKQISNKKHGHERGLSHGQLQNYPPGMTVAIKISEKEELVDFSVLIQETGAEQ